MSERLRWTATDGVLDEALEEAERTGASALGAAVHAYLSYAGQHPGVLLSPVVMTLAGFGARRALDGRCRQPGLGAKRPRGLLPNDAVPDAARVAAPQSLALLLVAQTYDERSTRSQALGAAARHARRAGSPERATVLEAIGQYGARALGQDSIRRPLLAAAGPLADGQLSSEDLVGATDLDHSMTEREGGWLEGSFSDTTASPSPVSAATSGLSWAAAGIYDRRGTVCQIAFGLATTGLEIPQLGLRAPLLAEPVVRGVSRVRPGTAIAASAKLSLLPPSSTPGLLRLSVPGASLELKLPKP